MRKRKDLISDKLVGVTQVNRRTITLESIQADPVWVSSRMHHWDETRNPWFPGPGWGPASWSLFSTHVCLHPYVQDLVGSSRTLVFRM